MGDRSPAVQAWLDRWSPAQRDQVEGLASLVTGAAPDTAADVKWGRLTFTVGGDWHHWLCAVAVSKRVVSLVFHKGVLLDDPSGLLQGTGRYVRQVPHGAATADAEATAALVREAVAHQTDMLDETG